MACRKFCRVYGGQGRRKEEAVPPETKPSRVFPHGPFYTPAEDACLDSPPPETPKPSHTTPPGDAERLCHLQEILAQMYGNQDYPIEDDPSADAADDVDEDARTTWPIRRNTQRSFFCPGTRPVPLSGPTTTSLPVWRISPGIRRRSRDEIGATGFTAEELDAMDREAARAISRGGKPPSTMAKLVTGMGFTIHGALTPGSEGCVFDSSHPDYPQRVIVKAGGTRARATRRDC